LFWTTLYHFPPLYWQKEKATQLNLGPAIIRESSRAEEFFMGRRESTALRKWFTVFGNKRKGYELTRGEEKKAALGI
jgi:hypothetical protein